jgi:predicted ATP-grasp superfamily ATP-dependent carboligase
MTPVAAPAPAGPLSAASSASGAARVRTRPGGAVVIGGDFNGLGVVRSLGRLGIPVCVIDDEHSISRASRYCTHYVRVPDLRDHERTVASVLEVGKTLGLDGWVLYPTRDETVAAFARARVRLSERFRVPVPEWDVTRWAWDKRNTHELAAQLDIPAPRTWYVEGPEEAATLDAEGPFAVKPAIKEHFIYATKAKAWRADTRAELVDCVRRAVEICGPGEVMVQELIPGDGRRQYSFCAFFKNGRAVASMTARRLRQHPPEFGRASTYVETVEEPRVEELAVRLLRGMGYYGLAEVEFKQDPRDGRFKVLDVNARTWGYHTLGRAAGVDFPALLFADQAGDRVRPCRARAGVRWVRLVTDLPTGVLEVGSRRVGPVEYLQSLRMADAESVFCRDDPLPALAELAMVPYLAVKRGF